VVGASFDTVEDNRAFAEDQQFNFPLLSDIEREVGALYEVVRAPDDQYASFPLRISYLLDPTSIIRRAYAVSDVAGHVDAVLADLARIGPAG
jgi:thioredoxin-dependent peroxiredoxin